LHAGSALAASSALYQVIEARARATQFAAGDRWFGLVSRLQDDNNFYFLTVRSSNSVSLRRFMNGRVAVLDSAEFPVSVGTWYTLRLQPPFRHRAWPRLAPPRLSNRSSHRVLDVERFPAFSTASNQRGPRLESQKSGLTGAG
jgi:hypothetical protein